MPAWRSLHTKETQLLPQQIPVLNGQAAKDMPPLPRKELSPRLPASPDGATELRGDREAAHSQAPQKGPCRSYTAAGTAALRDRKLLGIMACPGPPSAYVRRSG